MTHTKPAQARSPRIACIRRDCLRCLEALALLAAGFAAFGSDTLREAPVVDGEAPRIQALLEQGWAAESGIGLARNPMLAAVLYRQAGELGSGEGYYRAGVIHLNAAEKPVPAGVAACLLTTASQLGHHRAADLLERASTDATREATDCDDEEGFPAILAQFDMEQYMESLPASRKFIIGLIRKLAPAYAVDVRLAMAVASVESNFNPHALSPKMAMGVMQLIPATAERFNVRKPFDPEQNIRGGLAYLQWLGRYYRGDVMRVVAAYNAGEKAVDLYRGIPPYRETISYVARVLGFSGVKPLLPSQAGVAKGYRPLPNPSPNGGNRDFPTWHRGNVLVR